MAQKRIESYGRFTPSPIDNSASQRMEALAGFAKATGDLAFKIGYQKRQQQGAEEGVAAGIEAAKTGEMVSQPSNFTAYGSSFNESSALAFKAQTKLQLSNIIATAADEHSNDLLAYQAVVQGAYKGLNQNVPDAWKVETNFMFEALNSAAELKIQSTQRAKQKENNSSDIIAGLVTSADDVAALARSGNLADANELAMQMTTDALTAVKNGDMSQDTFNTMADSLKSRMVIQSALGDVDRRIFDPKFTSEEQLQQGRDYIEKLRANPREDLTPEENDTLISTLSAKVSGMESKRAQDDARLTQEQAKAISDLEILIANGVGDPEEKVGMVDKLFGDKKISGAKRTELMNKIFAVSKSERTKLDGINKVNNVLKGDGTSDRTYTQEDVNNHYVMQTFSEDPQERSAQLVFYVQQTGVMPKNLKLEITNKLNAGNSQDLIEAAETLNQLTKIPVVGSTLFTPEERAVADIINSQSSFKSAEELISLVKNMTDPNNQAQREERTFHTTSKSSDNNNKYRQAFSTDSIRATIREHFNKNWLGTTYNAAQEAELMSTYENIFKQNWIAGFETLKAASDNAIEMMKTQYSASDEFGVMRFSPTRFHNPVGGWEPIIESMKNEVSAMYDKPIKKVFVVTDKQTEREIGSNNPSYGVRVLFEDGSFDFPSSRFEFGTEIKNANEATTEANKLLAKSASELALNKAGSYKKVLSEAEQQQQDKMRKTLQGSTSPFALIGKGIEAITTLPEVLTAENISKVSKLAFTGSQMSSAGVSVKANTFSEIVPAIKRASKNYVDSLKKTEFSDKDIAGKGPEVVPIEQTIEVQATVDALKKMNFTSQEFVGETSGKVYPSEPIEFKGISLSRADAEQYAKDPKWMNAYITLVEKVGQFGADDVFAAWFGDEMVKAINQLEG
jgi:hypothetical protein